MFKRKSGEIPDILCTPSYQCDSATFIFVNKIKNLIRVAQQQEKVLPC